MHWSKKTMSHDELIAELKLEDKTLEERDFVRIEITPKTKDIITRNPDDWQLKLDEVRTLPAWYEKNTLAIQKNCWQAWNESIHISLLLEHEETEQTDTLLYAYGSAKAVLHGSANAELYDSAKAELKSDFCVVLCHRKILVTEKATVIRTSQVDSSKIS